jgi:hypothetical protein
LPAEESSAQKGKVENTISTPRHSAQTANYSGSTTVISHNVASHSFILSDFFLLSGIGTTIAAANSNSNRKQQ